MNVLNKDKILEAAKDFVTQGKLDKAIREYEKLLSVDPKDMRVKLRIAELYAKRRQNQEAIKIYREVADNYTHDGFFLKAVTVLKNITRLNPSLMDVNQALAELYEKMGLNQDASHQYEILAQAFDQKGEYEKALKIREKLVNLFPEEPSYRIRLAEAYQREDQKDGAIEQFEILAGQYQKEKRDPKKLIDLYEKILPARPENQEMLTDLVDLYYEAKNYKAALKWLEQKKQLVAADSHLLSLSAKMYAELNQLDTARSKYQQLATLYLEKGESDQALQCYEAILVLLPEEAEEVSKEVEKIQTGIFPDLFKRANERRSHKEKEAEQKVIKEEEEREEKAKKAEEAKKQPEAKKPPKKPLPPKPRENIEGLLRMAKTSLSLIKAYQSTGLQEEAKLEQEHAKKALEKILTVDPNHTEAKNLLQELANAS